MRAGYLFVAGLTFSGPAMAHIAPQFSLHAHASDVLIGLLLIGGYTLWRAAKVARKNQPN